MGAFGQLDVLMTERHLQGPHHESKQLNGAPGSHADGAEASAAQEASGTMQHIAGQEQAAYASAQATEQELKQHGQADIEAAEAEQLISTRLLGCSLSPAVAPEESNSRAERAPKQSSTDMHGGQMGSQPGSQQSPFRAAKGADNSAGQLQAQQKPQESPVSKGVPRLRIPPLSPRPASGLELPGSRATQPDSSAKSRGNAPEQSPDEGWSPRQVSMLPDKSQLQHILPFMGPLTPWYRQQDAPQDTSWVRLTG